MTSPYSDSDSDSSAFSFDGKDKNSVLSKLAGTVRDTRTKVEQKKSELNATMQERLPEWRSRGAMYGNRARETSMEWSRKGKEAVDRWKKDRQDKSSGYETNVFGLSLEAAITLTKLTETDVIPAVLRRCINYLDEYGIHEVGIYRIPGSTLQVNKLRSTFDSGHDSDFFATRPDPNAVATLLKMYIRELPEPIIPQDIDKEYKQQINEYISQKKPSTTDELPAITPSLLDTIRTITSRLPIIHLNLLKVLCQHLGRIAGNSEENKMSTSNLALVFIPTLGMGRLLFHCMIDHYNQIFGPSAGPTTLAKSSLTIKPLPPPVPLKPKHISPRRQIHNKTLSDTDVISIITPPPKPPRSPIAKPVVEYFRPNLVQTKARSKSVSSSQSPLSLQSDPLPIIRASTTTPPIKHVAHSRSRSRVEAIGRQFEQLVTKSNSLEK